jgi:hypothetical protein
VKAQQFVAVIEKIAVKVLIQFQCGAPAVRKQLLRRFEKSKRWGFKRGPCSGG